jgi:hypothetical protein
MDPTDGAVLAKLEATVAAVNALVPAAGHRPAARRWSWARSCSPPGSTGAATPPRGWPRSPPTGAVYVQRNDPDVAMLLGIGAYAPPVVG